MIDLNNIDIDEFRTKMEAFEDLMVSKESINNSIKGLKGELAEILGVKKEKVTSIIKMLTNIEQEGEVFDEELVEDVKKLYDAYKEED